MKNMSAFSSPMIESKRCQLTIGSFSSLILIAVVLSNAGCGKSSSQNTAEKQPVVTENLSQSLAEVSLSTALTSSEVDLFLKVVQQLPNQEVPHFGKIELPAFVLDGQVDTQLVKLKRMIRAAITPEALAESWKKQPEILNSLQQMQIQPTHFAGLCLKVSSSWTRHRYSQQIVTMSVIEETELKSLEVARILNQYRLEGWDTQELSRNLTEMAALSEFLKLLASTPQESLTTITLYAQVLGKVIPDDKWMKPIVELNHSSMQNSNKQNSSIQPVSWEQP